MCRFSAPGGGEGKFFRGGKVRGRPREAFCVPYGSHLGEKKRYLLISRGKQKRLKEEQEGLARVRGLLIVRCRGNKREPHSSQHAKRSHPRFVLEEKVFLLCFPRGKRGEERGGWSFHGLFQLRKKWKGRGGCLFNL